MCMILKCIAYTICGLTNRRWWLFTRVNTVQQNVSDNELDVCVTMHHQYNDVSNQQDATIFTFINIFNSTLHVSGDKFAHPQEHFLTVYTAFGTMHRHCFLPVTRLRWN